MGQVSSARIQVAPLLEKMLNGIHLRHTPASPRKCSQELVARNGGRARATIATAMSNLWPPRGSALAQSAAIAPTLSASNVAAPLIKKLFLSSTQFIAGKLRSVSLSLNPNP